MYIELTSEVCYIMSMEERRRAGVHRETLMCLLLTKLVKLSAVTSLGVVREVADRGLCLHSSGNVH